MCSAHDWLVSVRLSGFGTFCSGAHARITEWLSDFRQHKTLRVSPLVCHFPFLPRQISEKTPGNLAGLWAAKPIALKAAGPRAPWPPAWPGASLRCSPCREHTLPSVLPPPAPAPAPWFHTSVPKLTFSSLSFSFHPPHPAFFLTAGKNFVHTSSEPSTKLRFLVATTCPSASSNQDGGRHDQTAGTSAWVSAPRLLTLSVWGGCGVTRCFCFCGKGAGKPPGFRLFFSLLF